jgi:hypothetical protein
MARDGDAQLSFTFRVGLGCDAGANPTATKQMSFGGLTGAIWRLVLIFGDRFGDGARGRRIYCFISFCERAVRL